MARSLRIASTSIDNFPVPGGVLTQLALNGMPPETFDTIMIDKPELAGGFCVYLSAPSRYGDTEAFLGRYVSSRLQCCHPLIVVNRRYVSANWDVEDMAKTGKEMAQDARVGRWLMTKVLVF